MKTRQFIIIFILLVFISIMLFLIYLNSYDSSYRLLRLNNIDNKVGAIESLLK